ncbi:hypothetical protein HK405_001540 [Cladochytrium tenue]|nr:hypothetical protein HK405_001540 [Cladochytrium tenue]
MDIQQESKPASDQFETLYPPIEPDVSLQDCPPCPRHGPSGACRHDAFLSYRLHTDHAAAAGLASAFDDLVRRIDDSIFPDKAALRLFADFWCVGPCSAALGRQVRKRALDEAVIVITMLSEDAINAMIRRVQKESLGAAPDPQVQELESALAAARAERAIAIPVFVPHRSASVPQTIFDRSFYAAAPRVGDAVLGLLERPGMIMFASAERVAFDLLRCMDSAYVKDSERLLRDATQEGFLAKPLKSTPSKAVTDDATASVTLARLIGGYPVAASLAASYARNKRISLSEVLTRTCRLEVMFNVDPSDGMPSQARVERPFPQFEGRRAHRLFLWLHLDGIQRSMSTATPDDDLPSDVMSILHALAFSSPCYPSRLDAPLLVSAIVQDGPLPGPPDARTARIVRACRALRALAPSGIVRIFRHSGCDRSTRVHMPLGIQQVLQNLVAVPPRMRPGDMMPVPALLRVARGLVASYAMCHQELELDARSWHPLRLLPVAFKCPPRAIGLLRRVENDSAAVAHLLDGALSIGKALQSVRSSTTTTTAAATDWDVLEENILRIGVLRWACGFMREARGALGVLLELQLGLINVAPKSEGWNRPWAGALAWSRDRGQDALGPRLRRRQMEACIVTDAVAFLSQQIEDHASSEVFRREALYAYRGNFRGDHVFVARQLDGLARVIRRQMYLATGGAPGRPNVSSHHVPDGLSLFRCASRSKQRDGGGGGSSSGENDLNAMFHDACQYADKALATYARAHGTDSHLDVAYALGLAACVKGEAALGLTADGRVCRKQPPQCSTLLREAQDALARLQAALSGVTARVAAIDQAGPAPSASHESYAGLSEFEEDSPPPAIWDAALELAVAESGAGTAAAAAGGAAQLLAFSVDGGAVNLDETLRRVRWLEERGCRAAAELGQAASAGATTPTRMGSLRYLAMYWIKTSTPLLQVRVKWVGGEGD